MKKILNYIKNILKVLIWPIVFTLGTFVINYIFVALFNSKEKGIMNNNEFIEHIKTLEYQEKLNNYINDKSLLSILLTFLILFPILYKIFKKYKTNNKLKLKDNIIIIILGVTICLVFNIIVYYLNSIFNFTNNYEISNIPIIVQIICSGICGPILEETVFRGIVYNKLKAFNKKNIAIILTSIIFCLFHTDIVNAIYAFIVSFILIYLYDTYKTLKAPVLMHISLNITIILMLNLIIKNYLIFNLYLLIVSIIILLILKIYLKKMYK